jgi:hypothetical protein
MTSGAFGATFVRVVADLTQHIYLFLYNTFVARVFQHLVVKLHSEHRLSSRGQKRAAKPKNTHTHCLNLERAQKFNSSGRFILLHWRAIKCAFSPYAGAIYLFIYRPIRWAGAAIAATHALFTDAPYTLFNPGDEQVAVALMSLLLIL